MHNQGLYGQSLYGVLDSPDKLGMVPTVVWGEYITPWARRGGSSPFFDSTPDWARLTDGLAGHSADKPLLQAAHLSVKGELPYLPQWPSCICPKLHLSRGRRAVKE